MQSICTDVSLDVRYVVVGLTILYVSHSFTGMQLHNIVLIKHSAGLHSSYVGVGQGGWQRVCDLCICHFCILVLFSLLIVVACV